MIENRKEKNGLWLKPIRKRGPALGEKELTISKDDIETLDNIKPKKDGEIRILIFGGVGEIGKNMYAMEYEDTILIFDCGCKFDDEAKAAGIDSYVPNIQYLEKNKHKIKGMFITHGHLDHIGGIPVLINKLGNPTIYTRKLSIEMINLRQQEYHTDEQLKFIEIEKGDVININDKLNASFFAVTHTIPDSMGIIINTPLGDLVFTGDLKLDHVDGVVDEDEVNEFEVFKDRNVLISMADSTNAQNPGFSFSEKKVVENICNIIRDSKGRMIVSSFSSQIERNTKIIDYATSIGKKIVIEGRSMKTNLSIASELGILKTPISNIINVDRISDYPKDKIFMMVTGAQGDKYAALDRMSLGEHKVKLDDEDTLIFSSSIVPGNEETVQKLKDRLSKLGANLITYQTSDVHSSGHANREELRWIHKKINAKFSIPIHGHYYMQKAHGEILEEIGMKKENIAIVENGSIVDISKDGKTMTKQDYKMPTKINVIDGSATGVVQDVVLRDRRILRNEGIFIIIILINQRNREIKKSPDIISRGFVYLKESKDLIYKARIIGKECVERELNKGGNVNVDYIKKELKIEMQKFLYSKTKKRPIIIPVIFFS